MPRRFFSWPFVAPALLLVGGAIVAMVLESQFSVWLSALAGAWVIITIWIDDEIHRKVAWSILAGLCTVAAILIVNSVIAKKELLEKEGSLVPANLPMPLSNCPIPLDALAIYLGSNVAWTTTFPHTVFRSNGYDLVVIDRDLTGGILVTAKIFDDRRDLVAELVKNHFVTTNYSSHFERPDRSTLVVYDHLGVPSLKVQFINDRAIEIPTAQIRAPGGKVLLVRPDAIIPGVGGRIVRSCFGTTKGADFTFF